MQSLPQQSLDQLFLNARSYSAWQGQRVSDEKLAQIYELMKWGPTSANASPARIVFVKSDEAKEKLLTCVAELNVEKTRNAPVTAIIAEDLEFYDKLPKLIPHKDVRSYFVGNKELTESTAFRNSSLQGAYFMIAARALGLDCGPMSGFDQQKLDEAFFAGTSWRSNFLCNLGYGDPDNLFPRLPRLSFEEACQII